MPDTPQRALMRAAEARGVSLSALSRMLGRNVAYLQQFVGRGTPRVLPERERRMLADFLGLDETALGAPPRDDSEVAVPYLTVAAAAGAGRAVAEERTVREMPFARSLLRDLGVMPGNASVIDVAGESMAPLLLDGDRVLVDRGDRRVPPAGAVFVIRRDEVLAVKRLVPAGGAVEVRSDNPAFATVSLPAREVTVVGRARLVVRVV